MLNTLKLVKNRSENLGTLKSLAGLAFAGCNETIILFLYAIVLTVLTSWDIHAFFVFKYYHFSTLINLI